jgi:hypothetical protein
VTEVDVEDTAGTEDSVETSESEKKGKRAKLPAGYGAPIQFAHALTERLTNEGRTDKLDEDGKFRPQLVYSYIKSKSKVDPFPVHYVDADGNEYDSADGDEVRPALLLDAEGNFTEAMEWWDRKEERKAASAAKAKEKAEKKASKTEASNDAVAADEPHAEVEEAE